jgi:hypothetical protein
MHLVGFALPDKDDGEPAAAFAAAVANTGYQHGLGGFHSINSLHRAGHKKSAGRIWPDQDFSDTGSYRYRP